MKLKTIIKHLDFNGWYSQIFLRSHLSYLRIDYKKLTATEHKWFCKYQP
jgi:predicted RNA binding protein YcfA (HicA-like mRNA interferase family)